MLAGSEVGCSIGESSNWDLKYILRQISISEKLIYSGYYRAGMKMRGKTKCQISVERKNKTIKN